MLPAQDGPKLEPANLATGGLWACCAMLSALDWAEFVGAYPCIVALTPQRACPMLSW